VLKGVAQLGYKMIGASWISMNINKRSSMSTTMVW
jgi:hypothetical protein